jgi:DNA invertase Pin-like site-specific DNA recombinase
VADMIDLKDKQKFVVYYRVSTKKQGDSGLGLDAQKRDITLFFRNYVNGFVDVLERFTDIDSGGNDERVELTKAIELAKKTGATLVAAKLDRLSRKVSFIAKLLEDKKLEFRVACMPNADKFQLHIYAALAEQERDFISKRTIDALKQAKARGVVLGGLRDKTNQRNKVVQEQANTRAEKLKGVVKPMREQGLSLQKIADELNRLEIKTPRHGLWTGTAVSRAIKRWK